MKRRNVESNKNRKQFHLYRKCKFTDGMYGNTFLYIKFFLVWCLIMIADYLIEFRFEMLWPFWLLIRSIYDSFKYQGLIFSMFFALIALISDLFCYLFIPVQWLFFASSTYVWVQYVWHTERGICLSTIFLWLFFVYIEATFRLKNLKTIDLCRPFAAHCIGYPMVTLGFGLKSYLSFKLRLRKQKEIRKTNNFYMRLLMMALPLEMREQQKQELERQHHQIQAQASDIDMVDESVLIVDTSESISKSNGSSSSLVQNLKEKCTLSKQKQKSSSTSVAIFKETQDEDSPYLQQKEQMQHNQQKFKSAFSSQDLHFSSNQKKDSNKKHSNGAGGGGGSGSSGHSSSSSTTSESSSHTFSTAAKICPSISTNHTNININMTINATAIAAAAATSTSTTTNSHASSSGSKKNKTNNKQQTNYQSSSSSSSSLSPNATIATTHQEVSLNTTASTLASQLLLKDEFIQRLEVDLKRMQQELAQQKAIETYLKNEINYLNQCERADKLKLDKLHTDNELLQTRVNKINSQKQKEKEELNVLEKKLIDEKRTRNNIESQLALERKNNKENQEKSMLNGTGTKLNTKNGDNVDLFKQKLKDIEFENKKLQEQMNHTNERLVYMENDALLKQEEYNNQYQTLTQTILLLEQKNSSLQESLSSETRVKMNLISALGDARRQQEQLLINLKLKEDEIVRLQFSLNTLMHNDSSTNSFNLKIQQQQQQQQSYVTSTSPSLSNGSSSPQQANTPQLSSSSAASSQQLVSSFQATFNLDPNASIYTPKI